MTELQQYQLREAMAHIGAAQMQPTAYDDIIANHINESYRLLTELSRSLTDTRAVAPSPDVERAARP